MQHFASMWLCTKSAMMSGSPLSQRSIEAVNELMTRNSPPKLGGEPARTAKREPDRAKPQKKSEQAGWFPCRYWQLREPPRPRLRSGTPPNLGGECRQCSSLDITGGHRPPLQMKLSQHPNSLARLDLDLCVSVNIVSRYVTHAKTDRSRPYISKRRRK